MTRDLLRDRDRDARVTNIELFFDLVFVFAVTQLSHLLLHDVGLIGALHAAILFRAVWWPGSTRPGSPTGSIRNIGLSAAILCLVAGWEAWSLRLR